MTSSTTFTFTRRPEMSGEYTFQFTSFQGEIIFNHEWSLGCYNVWGKYTGSGSEGGVHLPYNIQLRVKNMWGSQNFGRLYIEAKEVTANSITVKYWIKCYHPGEWYSGLTFSGKLTCITPGDTQTEIIRTYTRPFFVDENLATEFPLESRVFVRATDGISTGGTRDCTVTTESGEQITIPLVELPDAPGYYIGSFLITSGRTWEVLRRLHMEEFERATLKCDVNQDGVYSYWEIWAERKGPGQLEVVITFADSEYTEIASSFDAEATVFVLATGMYIGPAGTRNLRVVTDSGDEINITLNEVTFASFAGFFLVTDGETDDDLNRLHLEPGEGATLYVDINGDGIPATCRISRNRIIIGEVVTTYEDGNYTLPEDTFDHEATVYVDATDLISTGGIRELIVKADSGDEIHVDLIEWPVNHYRGSFKVTEASTSDELNQIHLDLDERAILYCDIDGDGQSASCEIWCGTKPEITVTYATHYQIQVNTQRDMLGTMMWDSQKCGFVNPLVPGERCPDIEYAGSTLDLSGQTTYWWRIKFWMNYGTVETLWSTEEAYFSGIMVYPYLVETLKTYSDDSYAVEKDTFLPEETVYVEATNGVTTGATPLLGILADTGDRISLTLTEGPSTKYRGTFVVTSGATNDPADQIHLDWAERAVLSCDINNDDIVAFHEIWCGVKPDVPVPDPFPPSRYPIRKPRGKVEVEINGAWTDLHKVTAVQVSNNKNPLDNIETAQGTVYLSNIDEEFYPDKTTSQFFDQLFGRKIRMNLGFLDYARQGALAFRQKMMGIVKNVSTDRSAQTAEIVALEFMDFYRKKQIKITPVYEDISLFDLYCELVRYCFPSWLNQTETAGWNYWVDPLGFKRTNIYIGTGKLGGSEFIPIRDFSRTPPEWIYSIIPDSEAIYDDEGFRLKRGEDYEIIREETDKGIESWIHFLKLPYPTNEDGFYVAITVDIRVSAVQYKDTTLIEELEDIALVSDCRLYADEYGRLICKSNELKEEVTDTISHDLNLMALSTRKDIDSIINHVVVESRPYQIGADVEIGTWEITFSRRPEAEKGKEFDFASDEFVENFRFDLTWSLQCSQWLGDCVGSGSASNIELPFSTDLPLAGAIGCTGIYGHLYIEPVAFDSNHITVKFYLDCIHEQHYDNAIVFSATLACHAGGIGQPETYKGEAIDEASYQNRYIGRRKRTFTLDYLEPGDTQARQAAERILGGLRKIRIYYDCEVRGMPHLRLMDTVTLTEPKADLSEKKLQVIKLVDSMQVANYIGEVGLMERKVPSAVPWYWETAEHDFIINTQEQLIQTYKFIFDSEILQYKLSHNYSVDVSTTPKFWILPSLDCHGEGTDENFDLPYTVNINVYWAERPEVPLEFGTLTITLIEETSTSIEIQYKLEVPGAENFLWPIDWLGTLSIEAQFASQSPGTDGGDEPPDQPHYPPDEPDTPPQDEPDDGWDYKTEFSWNGCKLLYAGEIDVSRVLAAGFNTTMCYLSQSRLDECLAKGLWVIASVHSYFAGGSEDISGAVNFVNTWKHHPAIAAWYFLDEPEYNNNPRGKQQSWYNALKAADPTRDFLTVFSTHGGNYEGVNYFSRSAFDHCGVDVYPFNSECFDYGPGKWNGDWQGYMKYCLDRWNQFTNSIGGMAVAQTYHDIPHGMLSPIGNIRGMLNVFQDLSIGRQSDGYAMYCWTDGLTGDSRGISEDAALESEVRSVNASYNWPHTPPRVW